MNPKPDELDGGPAFPCQEGNFDTHGIYFYSGMSLRDYFAAAALQGLLAANAKCHEEVTDKNVDDVIAREAYSSADAMLIRRKQ